MIGNIALLLLFIAVPFLFLSYGIFLIGENKKNHYGAVYGKAMLSILIFGLILGTYLDLPFVAKALKQSDGQPIEGNYVSSAQDSLCLEGGKVIMRNHHRTSAQTGTYEVVTPYMANNGFDWMAISSFYFDGPEHYSRLVYFTFPEDEPEEEPVENT